MRPRAAEVTEPHGSGRTPGEARNLGDIDQLLRERVPMHEARLPQRGGGASEHIGAADERVASVEDPAIGSRRSRPVLSLLAIESPDERRQALGLEEQVVDAEDGQRQRAARARHQPIDVFVARDALEEDQLVLSGGLQRILVVMEEDGGGNSEEAQLSEQVGDAVAKGPVFDARHDQHGTRQRGSLRIRHLRPAQ